MPYSTHITSTCLGCGKVATRQHHQKPTFLCSQECRAKRKKEKYREHNPLDTSPLQCAYCKKDFAPSPFVRYKAKYCSVSCKKKVKNRKLTEYLRANPELRTAYYRDKACARKWCGNWWKALERDKFTCRICGHLGNEGEIRNKRILVHHLDREGETGANNHALENLWTVCYDCHEGLHGISVVFLDGQWRLQGKIFERMGIAIPEIQCYTFQV